MMVSFYIAKNQGKTADIEFSEFLAGVKSGKWDAQVLPVRALYGTSAYDQAKPSLPSIAASGVFAEGYYYEDKGQRRFCTGRTLKDQQSHSGIIYLDLDRKKNPGMVVAALRAEIEADSYTYTCHLSLSGDGLAVAFRVPTEDAYGSFRALAAYYQQRFGVVVDSLPDPTRLRFVTSDPALYVNEQAAVFEETLDEPKTKAAPRAPIAYTPAPPDGSFLIQRAVRMVHESQDGGKHQALRDAAYLLGGYIASGYVPEQSALEALLNAISSKANVADHKQAELTIRSGLTKGQEKPLLPEPQQLVVRQQHRQGFGREAIAAQLAMGDGVHVDKLEPAVAAILDAPNPTIRAFWKLVPSSSKREAPADKVVIDRVKLRDWLSTHGFCYRPNGAAVQLLRVVHHVVSPCERYDLKRYLLEYVEALPEFFDDCSRADVLDLVLAQVRGLFDKELLECLRPLAGEFIRDSAAQAHFFFQNCWVQVTADERQMRPYAELPGLIWASQVRPHEYVELHAPAAEQCDFHQFTRHITADNSQRLAQLQSALGYLLHGYKHADSARAVIFVDEVAVSGKPAGGTGKSLLLRAVGELVKVTQLPGATFKFEDNFRFQRIDLDTRVAYFDEWDGRRLPFKKLFSEITSEMAVNKKNAPEFVLPFAESPKFAISTNDVVSGEGSSHERRKLEIALAPHYSDRHTPRDEFGTGFFEQGWDKTEYCRFYNLALGWVQRYLAQGLQLLASQAIAGRKLEQDTSPEFVEFVRQVGAGDFDPEVTAGETVRLWAADLYQAYTQEVGENTNRFTLRHFIKWMERAGFSKLRWVGRQAINGHERRNQWYFLKPKAENEQLAHENL